MKLLLVHQVGDDPDVLAFDTGLGRLYVSAESGTVTVQQVPYRQCSACRDFRLAMVASAEQCGYGDLR